MTFKFKPYEIVEAAIIRIAPTRIMSFGIDDTDTPPHELTPDIRDV